MRTNRRAAVLALSAALVTSVLSTWTPAVAAGPVACTWTPELLPVPSGVLTGRVDTTDHAGGYAGVISYGADSAEGAHAVLWKNGKMTDYGHLSSPEYQNWVSVYDVNKAGTVIGAVHRESDGTPSAVHSRNGRMERLPELPDTIASRATGINNSGDIVGGVETVDGWSSRWHPVRWPAGRPGEVEVLSGLSGESAYATGVDEDGTVLLAVVKDWTVPYL
uniref:QmnM n=1 Tax=Amycolatopsis orientalis TaxID=31958 RepID=K4FDR2_AMYOR|nr:QmnM [Amycolatopsis orientalis]